MTWAVNHPDSRRGVDSARWTAAGAATRPVRVPWVGLFIALLGAWGGIVAFVGPAFGYHPTTTSTWQWTTTNWLLHLVPGAMALFAGLVILGWTTSWASFKARGALAFAALLAVVAGAWFVIGPALWPWFQSSAAYGPATDAQTSFVNQVGANLGPGVLLAMLGGMALKTAFSARRMATVAEPAGDVRGADSAAAADGGYASRSGAGPDGGYGHEGGYGPEGGYGRQSGSGAAADDPTATNRMAGDQTAAGRQDRDIPPA